MVAIPALLEDMGHIAELSASEIVEQHCSNLMYKSATLIPRNWHPIQLESMRRLAYETVSV